jgi:hypothetical protein
MQNKNQNSQQPHKWTCSEYCHLLPHLRMDFSKFEQFVTGVMKVISLITQFHQAFSLGLLM